MADIVIDTDVASVIQKGTAPIWVRRHVAHARVWLTFVTVGELWKWAEVRSWAQPRRSRLEEWLANFPVLPYDPDVARTWGVLAAATSRRGQTRPQNDTWIAACCVRHGLPLLTLNLRDFVEFESDGLVLAKESDQLG